MQTTVAFAIVSQELKTRTSKFIFVILLVAKASASVTANGSPINQNLTSATLIPHEEIDAPSGTATTITVTEMIRI